jgi:hypothetical protein
MWKVISSVKSNLITMLNRRERVNKTTEAATQTALPFDTLQDTAKFCHTFVHERRSERSRFACRGWSMVGAL